MTEKEAQTKWCPFARVAGLVQTEAAGTSYNRWPGPDGTAHVSCIGSVCMAWRVKRLPDGDQYGFCGLVGPAGKS